MRVLTLAAAIGLSVMATPTAQTPTTGQAPAGQTQTAQAPRVPFSVGAKVAFVNLQRVAAESNEGQAANAEVEALSKQKLAELEEKNLTLVTQQQKLQQGQTVLSAEARLKLQQDLEKMQLEIQRFNQDAEVEIQKLQRQLQLDFEKKLLPILDQVANDKQLQLVLSVGDSGLVWADPALDITDDVIAHLDAATGTPPAAAPSQPADEPAVR